MITDHKPLCPIFNGNRKGSIRTERIKLRHQDIRFTVNYLCGKVNQSDYLSRHAKPIEKLPREEQTEVASAIDCMGIGAIVQATSEDQTLQKIATLIKNGQTWIPKTQPSKVQHLRHIFPQLTLTGNGIILDERNHPSDKAPRKGYPNCTQGSPPRTGEVETTAEISFLFPRHG